MKPVPLKDKSDRELRKIIKETLSEKRRLREDIKTTSENLRELKTKYWKSWAIVRDAKTTLGKRKAKNCPAFKHWYGNFFKAVVCKAKRYKYHCWTFEEMWRRHCCSCKLSPSEAKTAMMYERILRGKQDEG